MMNLKDLKRNVQMLVKKKEPDHQTRPTAPEVEEDFSYDYWSDDEFSDVDSGDDNAVNDEGIYEDTDTREFRNNADDDEDYYGNVETEFVKTNEMQKTPPIPHQVGPTLPTLPPRKCDNVPKAPVRCKNKNKKPPLPEKIPSEPEDDELYEELGAPPITNVRAPPTTNIRAPPTTNMRAPPTTNVRAPPTTNMRAPPTTNMRAPPTTNTRALPTTNMRAPPTTNVRSPPNRCPQNITSSHVKQDNVGSISSRPRIETPKEKPTENPLNAFRWYHGDSERTVVERKLLQYKRDGMFAVRDSSTKGPSYPHAVTLYKNGKTFNFPIRIRSSDKRFALGTEKKDEPNFETVDILVDYFKSNKIKLSNDQFVLLSIPLSRSS